MGGEKEGMKTGRLPDEATMQRAGGSNTVQNEGIETINENIVRKIERVKHNKDSGARNAEKRRCVERKQPHRQGASGAG